MLQQKQVRSVLRKHSKRDSWFHDDYSVNPYEGCSCNCQYCYIRGSKYGLNMDDGLVVKANALDILGRELASRAKKGQYGFVAVGSATDAYIHHEEQLKITQGMLQLLHAHRFPVFISTKCALIKRDIALLKEIDQHAILPADMWGKMNRGVILSVSLSTLDPVIAKTLEPGALPPAERLALVKHFKSEGFLAGVNAMPLLPYISDTSEALEEIIVAAKNSGADYILTGSLTLFGNEDADSRTLYYKFLERYDPSLILKYQQLFGNKDYTPFHYQESLKIKAATLCKKHGIRNTIM